MPLKSNALLDEKGRQFLVRVNGATVRELRQRLGVDLMQLLEGNDNAPLLELIGNPVNLIDALYIFCREDADAQNLTDEDFGRGLAGEAIDRAGDALLAGIVDFFPRRRRPILQAILAKIREMETGATTTLTSRMDGPKMGQLMHAILAKAGEDVDATIDAELARLTGGSDSTNLPR
ncbi:MAG: hypothetical protein ACIALR_14855 [Blastopirellula sp. JB062]